MCEGFDVKEEIFRDLNCLFEKTLQVLHEWKNETVIRETIFLFLNEENALKLVKTQSINGTRHILELNGDEFATIKNEPGMWKVIVLENDTMIPLSISKFMVYGNGQEKTIDDSRKHFSSELYQNILKELKPKHENMFATSKFQDLWHFEEICSQENKEDQTLQRCSDVPWSIENVENLYLLR